jgi:hypothetical protein
MISVPTIEQRLAFARAHIEWGRGVIARQQQCVKELRESGHDTEAEKLLAAERLLAVFERTQKVFERDLADLEKRSWALQQPRLAPGSEN